MATAYIKTLLRDEVIAALKMSPCIGFLNANSPYVGVYPSERLDEQDGRDPKSFPALFVNMPEEESTESLSENFMRATYKVAIYAYINDERDIRADETNSKLANAIRIVLAANAFNTNMRKLGSYKNSARVSDDGWGERKGQDKCFRYTVTYVLNVPADELITV